MKLNKLGFWLRLLIVISILTFVMAGCNNKNDKKDTTYPDEPPSLPPSFAIDFAAFSSSNQASFLPDKSDDGNIIQLASYNPKHNMPYINQAVLGDQSNWNYAAGTVVIWSVIGVIGLAIPVAAFNASFHNIPVQQNDGSWIWSYSVRIGGPLYTAKLHGTYIANGVRWEMYISKEGGYTDFLWYYGESDQPATEGYWVLKNTPDNPTDLLRIDWTRTIADGTGSIKYTNIVPNGPENGGYIYTETNNDTPLNAYWNIYNKGLNNHTYIEWNRTTLEGHIRDFNHFKDDNWHCWDSQHKNSVCQ